MQFSIFMASLQKDIETTISEPLAVISSSFKDHVRAAFLAKKGIAEIEEGAHVARTILNQCSHYATKCYLIEMRKFRQQPEAVHKAYKMMPFHLQSWGYGLLRAVETKRALRDIILHCKRYLQIVKTAPSVAASLTYTFTLTDAPADAEKSVKSAKKEESEKEESRLARAMSFTDSDAETEKMEEEKEKEKEKDN